MKCQSLIKREFKSVKADCYWPKIRPLTSEPIDNPAAAGLPECGGELSISVRAEDEPYYGGTSASLKLEVVCTRCKFGYFEGLFALQDKVAGGSLDLSNLELG